ncbi:hypothetical protein CDAR_437121 [Caerostris darwini]|uniref:Uncharacterized protein n=1 Tax=Caerostris darwini TaxID=1538125 RepID=A0AAV4TVS0_9ARAC|nr:hypothetical protein CDAR_437121 [Caerostris darwini]
MAEVLKRKLQRRGSSRDKTADFSSELTSPARLGERESSFSVGIFQLSLSHQKLSRKGLNDSWDVRLVFRSRILSEIKMRLLSHDHFLFKLTHFGGERDFQDEHYRHFNEIRLKI